MRCGSHKRVGQEHLSELLPIITTGPTSPFPREKKDDDCLFFSNIIMGLTLKCPLNVLRASLSDHKLSDSYKVTPVQELLDTAGQNGTRKKHCGHATGARCYLCNASAGSHEQSNCYFR